MGKRTLSDWWDALKRPENKSNRAFGAEQRAAWTQLMDDEGTDKILVIERTAEWLSEWGLDDIDEILFLWCSLMNKKVDPTVRDQGAQILLNALDSFPSRGHLFQTLGKGEPGSTRAQQMVTGIPLLRRWLDERGDAQTAMYLMDRMLSPGLALACRSETGGAALRLVLEDPMFGAAKEYEHAHLVVDWVSYAAWDPGAQWCEPTLAMLLEHGHDLEAQSKEHTTALTEACSAMEDCDSPESKMAIDLLLMAGARWDYIEQTSMQRAWLHIQQHPRVRATALMELATPAAENRRPARRI